MYSILYAAAFFTLSIQLTIPRAKRLATSHHRVEVDSEDSAQVTRKFPVAVILDSLLYFRWQAELSLIVWHLPAKVSFLEMILSNYTQFCHQARFWLMMT